MKNWKILFRSSDREEEKENRFLRDWSSRTDRPLAFIYSLSPSGDKSRRMVNSGPAKCIETRNPKSPIPARGWDRSEGVCTLRGLPSLFPMNKQIQISSEGARCVNHRETCYTRPHMYNVRAQPRFARRSTHATSLEVKIIANSRDTCCIFIINLFNY